MIVNVIGGGLSGCEAAYRLACDGYEVKLYEMRGVTPTPCHTGDRLAELVCSNSLKSIADDTASGMLKRELEIIGCMTLECAYKTAVPAGGALAVDRNAFSMEVERCIAAMPNIEVIRQEITDIDFTSPTIIATGPLTSDKLSDRLSEKLGKELHFYDAIAPIVDAQSIDYGKAFFAARYGRGEADYLNCPMDKEEYLAFYDALVNAERVHMHSFEDMEVFEGCMPVEVMAKRGIDTLRFGPMRPVGLRTPSGDKPYAVVQLRKENLVGDAYNIVGFQTNLTFKEQKRVFAMIPALKGANYLRYGIMHRNTYIDAPDVLNADFSLKCASTAFIVGQLSGVEGYVESIASGLIGAINMSAKLSGKSAFIPPSTTIIGALCNHVSSKAGNYQPMNANFGILPLLEENIRDKKERKRAYVRRGVDDMNIYVAGRK